MGLSIDGHCKNSAGEGLRKGMVRFDVLCRTDRKIQ